MGKPAARANDRVTAVDTHIVLVPAGPSLVPTPLPHPFSGVLGAALANSVRLGGQPAAVVGSRATNTPAHIPTPPGTAFQRPPSNTATIQMGSTSVRFEGKAAARSGDIANTCNDPADMPVGTVVAVVLTRIGG